MDYDSNAHWSNDNSPAKNDGLATGKHVKNPCSKPLLSILSANMQGLTSSRSRHKLAMLGERAEEENICIMSLTETHLDPTFLKAEVSIDGFEFFRADRGGSQKRV